MDVFSKKNFLSYFGRAWEKANGPGSWESARVQVSGALDQYFVEVAPQLANHSPAKAAFLALIPGVGAVYNLQYRKALLQSAVFIGLFFLMHEWMGFVFVWLAFWFYIVLDSYRSAQAILLRNYDSPAVFQTGSDELNLPVWGGTLILLGFIFLSDSLGWVPVHEIARLWPLAFIAGGGYILYQYGQDQKRSSQRSALEQPTEPSAIVPNQEDS